MQESNWLPIPGYEGLYEISDQGDIKSLHRSGRRTALLMHPDVQKSGHGRIALVKDGIETRYLVHRLVALTFLGPSDLPVVRHLDDDPRNNAVGNLAWGTYAENTQDSIRNGTHRNIRKTCCKRGHEFTESNTFIRMNGRRECRTCTRALAVINRRKRESRGREIIRTA